MRFQALLITLLLLTLSGQIRAQKGLDPLSCDADGDQHVDAHDIDAITRADGATAKPGDKRDVDGDGMITAQDAKQCADSCDFIGCGDVKDKPNILVLMADDLGFNDLAINNGNTEIHTPNMDQLARQGVRFTRHYASSVCSPARAAFLSGMYPERLGYLPNGRGISPEVVTMPERLRGVGYTTWHIGKWHIGDLEPTAWPQHQGFDHWYGLLGLQLSKPSYMDPWMQGDTEPGRAFSGHVDDLLTDKAIEALTDLQAGPTPWFLNLWFYAPHAPVKPASEFAELYPNTKAGRYRAFVHQLDSNIGRIVSHLDDIGALQETIIVVVSDNGGTNSGVNSNYPYAGKKGQVREGSLRTPLLIQWPDKTINGQVSREIVSIEDIYPSLMAAIDLAPPEGIDGKNFYDSVARQVPTAQVDRFHELGSRMYGGLSADGRWRLFQPTQFMGVVPVPKLYDLEIDPTAKKSVLPPPKAESAVMLDRYQAWYKDVHTVRTEFSPTPYGGTLSGMSFLRTPGFQEYTIGVAISDDYQGQVAAQDGIWEIKRVNNTVVAQYGDLMLSGEIESAKNCHSIVVSGKFPRQLKKHLPPDRIVLSLYVDGIQVQSGDIASTLPVSDPTIETTFGDPDKPGQPGVAGKPMILNVVLDRLFSPWTVESFGSEICANL